MAAKPLWELVRRVGDRAGIAAPLHPHLLRHAFGDHIAAYGGLKVAQAMMGHSDVRTTENYTGVVKLEQLAIAIRGLRYDAGVIHAPQPTDAVDERQGRAPLTS